MVILKLVKINPKRSQVTRPAKLSSFLGFESLAKASQSPELQDFILMGIKGRCTRNHPLSNTCSII